jgi:hypothetical protein
MDPEVQAHVRDQWQGRRWCALDSIGYWIERKPEALAEVIGGVDLVLMNDVEARALTNEPMLLRAAREIMSWGPEAVVLRFGEYGCALLTAEGYFSLPGFPLEDVVDPTGGGDAFAGGFLGYLDLVRGDQLTEEVLRRALTFGLVMGSYCSEGFGARRLAGLTEREIRYRYSDIVAMTHFEHVPTAQRPRAEGEERGEDRLPAPELTPSLRARARETTRMQRTPSTETPRAPHRTPSTERLEPPSRPAPREVS